MSNAEKEPLLVTVDQRDAILRILSGEMKPGNSGGIKKLFFEVRAGKLMRQFNRLLRFSDTANVLYRDICGWMGSSHGRRPDETQVAIDVMSRWTPLGKRSIQTYIRELTLSGPLPLLEKRVQGGLGGRRNVYGFVLDPFRLAEKQALAAMTAKPDDDNVATRGPIRIVTAQQDEDSRCPTDAQIERFAASEGEPEYGDDSEREYYWMRGHIDNCRTCDKRLKWATSRCIREAS